MHPTYRFIVIAVLGVAIVPLAGTAVLLGDVTGDRAALQAKFEQTLDKAKASYGRRTVAANSEKQTQLTADEAFKKLLAVGKKKHDVRMQIVALRPHVRELEARRLVATAQYERLVRAYAAGEEEFNKLVQAGQLTVTAQENSIGYVFRRLLTLSFGSGLERDFQETEVARAREEYMVSLLSLRESAALLSENAQKAAADAVQSLDRLYQDRETLLTEYRDADKAYDQAVGAMQATADQIAAYRAEMAAVQANVLRLQSDMARIDARIREKAKRKLIDMGLMDAQQDDGTVQLPGVKFSWPVYGPVTAGFRDANYFKRFGVQHNAVDIGQGQGSPVSVSADGIVFLARDGGARGYSYILIGHRDGYATLYGHLSSFAVGAGDEVRQGQVIGMSGGKPGTYGAGLLTTGPHLHFEVIKNGANINPLNVLP